MIITLRRSKPVVALEGEMVAGNEAALAHADVNVPRATVPPDADTPLPNLTKRRLESVRIG